MVNSEKVILKLKLKKYLQKWKCPNIKGFQLHIKTTSFSVSMVCFKNSILWVYSFITGGPGLLQIKAIQSY